MCLFANMLTCFNVCFCSPTCTCAHHNLVPGITWLYLHNWHEETLYTISRPSIVKKKKTSNSLITDTKELYTHTVSSSISYTALLSLEKKQNLTRKQKKKSHSRKQQKQGNNSAIELYDIILNFHGNIVTAPSCCEYQPISSRLLLLFLFNMH